jgi:hypothetical protein
LELTGVKVMGSLIRKIIYFMYSTRKELKESRDRETERERERKRREESNLTLG